MDALTVSKAILCEANKRNIKIGRTKIQKLLYISYGGYYRYYNKPMFDEIPVYFPYGPVFESVLIYYKKFDFSKNIPPNSDCINEDGKFIIDNVLDVFGKDSANALSEWTHRDGSAWAKINERFFEQWGTDLRLPDIKKEFCGLIETWYISSIPHLKEQIIEASNAPLSEFITESELTW